MLSFRSRQTTLRGTSPNAWLQITSITLAGLSVGGETSNHIDIILPTFSAELCKSPRSNDKSLNFGWITFLGTLVTVYRARRPMRLRTNPACTNTPWMKLVHRNDQARARSPRGPAPEAKRPFGQPRLRASAQACSAIGRARPPTSRAAALAAVPSAARFMIPCMIAAMRNIENTM